MNKTPLEIQREVEEASALGGMQRFARLLKKAMDSDSGTRIGAQKRLLFDTMGALVEGFEEEFERASKQRGRKGELYRRCQTLGPERTAAITIQYALDSIFKVQKKLTFTRRLGEAVLRAARYDKLKRENPGLYNYRLNAVSKSSSGGHRERAMSATLRFSDVDVSEFTLTEHQTVTLGIQLMTVLFRCCPDLFHQWTHNDKGKVTPFVTGSDEAIEAIRDGNEIRELHAPPLHHPLAVQPLEWSPGEPGGYLFALRGDIPLIRGAQPWQEEAIEAAGDKMQPYYDALTTLQATEWRINRPVFRVIEELFERGGGHFINESLKEVAGVPPLQPIDTDPPRPLGIPPVGVELNEEETVRLRAWKYLKAGRFAAEAERIGKARSFLATLRVARLVVGWKRFWWVWNGDWRGRVYCVADHLNPLGNDVSRGLIEFAIGLPLGDRGHIHLALHGANCLDSAGALVPNSTMKLSKESLSVRWNWIVEHTDAIESVAADPFAHSWWQGAEDPFQFLAFCFDWAGYMKAYRQGKGPEYVSHLSVNIDGTCNGVQWVAALWRDTEAGFHVNLIPGETPEDLYQAVTTSTLDILTEQATHGDILSALWLSSKMVTRAICKRPCMTLAYGSKRFSWRDQILEALRKETGGREAFRVLASEIFGDQAYKAIDTLRDAIWDAANVALPTVMQGREWLQQCASLLGYCNTPLAWTVPGTGLPVRQASWVQKARRTHTSLGGEVCYSPRLNQDTTKLMVREQINGIVPNLVHSLDAAHLCLTAVACREAGVVSFRAVHDSFGCHAGQMDILARITREEFVKLHREPLLGIIVDTIKAQADNPDEVPMPPAQGKLDIEAVLDSTYFFA